MGDRHQFRAKWHDYAYGVYFVTVCCAYKQHYFGEILNERMEFSSAGIIATSQIQNIPKHFENVELLNFVVMPNHIHLVIAINKPIKSNQSAVGTLCQNSLNVGTCLWHVYPNRWFSGLTSQSDVPTSLNSRNLTHPHIVNDRNSEIWMPKTSSA